MTQTTTELISGNVDSKDAQAMEAPDIELEGDLREALDEQSAISHLEKELGQFMTHAAMRNFPALTQMNAEQIRKFGQFVTRSAGDFALSVANLAYAAEQQD